MTTRHAFIILSHYVTDRIRALVERAQAELGDTHDVHVLGYFPDGAKVPDAFRALDCATACTFGDLQSLGLPGVAEDPGYSIIPGDCDMPVLWFARAHPEYVRFWVFEGDADYTGSLKEFVEHLDQTQADLLLTLLGPAPREWKHFRGNQVPPGWQSPVLTRLRGYLPIFRVSRPLLDEIHEFYASGGRGHHEWVWPQVAEQAGMTCRDIRDFPLRGRPLYSSGPIYRERWFGTMRYRPAFEKPGLRRNTLWHPIKDCPIPLREKLRDSVFGIAFRETKIQLDRGQRAVRQWARRALGNPAQKSRGPQAEDKTAWVGPSQAAREQP